jgi:hypothetical protein
MVNGSPFFFIFVSSSIGTLSGFFFYAMPMRKCLCFVVLLLALASCQKGHMVTVTVHGSGSVSPLQVADVPTGESCTFTITPEPGNSLHTIKANARFDHSVTLTNTATTYLLPNITSDIALDVAFVASPYVKLTVEPSDTILPYGNTCMVTWETANVNPVYLNGEKVKYLSGANTYRLFASMKYTLTGHFGDYTFTDEQEVQVGPWYESTFGLVSYYPWRYKAFRISSLDGEVLYFWIPDPEILSWVFYFHKDGTTTFSNHPGVFEPWYLLDDNTIVRNRTAMKLEVSQHEMMVSYQTTYNGELVWFDMIHEHASDTPTDPV